MDTIGQNVAVTVDRQKLIIEIDLGAQTTPSASNKTLVVATTRGNQQVPGSDWTLGLNLYRKA